MKVKNLHLIVSVIIVIPIGILYGFQPELLFEVNVNAVDEPNIFKAIMGLYFGFASLWILGIFNSKFWQAATISNIIFMLGLGFGRIISILIDGMPSTIFVVGILGELVLGMYAWFQLKNQKSFD